MSTLSYHFPEFTIGAVRARARRCHPLRTPVSPVGRTRKDPPPPNYSTPSCVAPASRQFHRPNGFFQHRHKTQ